MSGFVNKLITDGSMQLLGTVANDGPFSLVTVRAYNATTADRNVAIWVTSSASPTAVDQIDGVELGPKARYEQNNIITSIGEKIYVQGDAGVVLRMEQIDEK